MRRRLGGVRPAADLPGWPRDLRLRSSAKGRLLNDGVPPKAAPAGGERRVIGRGELNQGIQPARPGRKKPHASDIDPSLIADAVSFTVSIFHDRRPQTQEGIGTLVEARAKGAEMKTTLQSNRDYIVYAVLKGGRSFPVPRDYEAPVTEESTMKPKTAKKTAPAKAAAKAKPAAKGKAKATANARTAVAGATTKAKKETKSDIVDRMLKTDTGAGRAELSEKTGWPSVNLKVAAERAGKDFKLVESKDNPRRFRLVTKDDKPAPAATA
jgi:hypothetical protein